MNLLTILATSVALAMDAFAVSISISMGGYCENKTARKSIPAAFGFFQMIMPIIGYFAASLLAKYIMAFDHFIAFLLLSFIGLNMIREAFSTDDDSEKYKDLTFAKLITFSLATSIDAMAAGISFAFLNINIFTISIIIGVITLCLSYIGIIFGRALGDRFKKGAEISGGIILIIIGIKVLIEHLINGI